MPSGVLTGSMWQPVTRMVMFSSLVPHLRNPTRYSTIIIHYGPDILNWKFSIIADKLIGKK